MRQRNYLLALVLLALFAAAGVGYFRAFVGPKKPFGIILFIGEGIVSSKLTAARLYDGGADHSLSIENLQHLALLRTSAADFAVPDAASAATALACGVKVNNRALATDPSGKNLQTVLELARARHRATGLITTGQLTDPAPAAFYAHAADGRDHDPLAVQLVEKADLDIVLGGGAGAFLPPPGGDRRDGRDLAQEMKGRGYRLVATRGDLVNEIEPWRGEKLFGLFGRDALFSGISPEAESPAPTLAEMVRASIETLQRHAGGYVLVVDAGAVERASLENRGEQALKELVELDRAVGVAMQYAGTDTLVLVAGGEATGGMALNGYPLRQDRGVSLLGATNAYGFPSISWATGPAGPVAGQPAAAGPAAFYSPYAANVADDVIAAGSGPGAERLHGFQSNTFVFELINSQL